MPDLSQPLIEIAKALDAQQVSKLSDHEWSIVLNEQLSVSLALTGETLVLACHPLNQPISEDWFPLLLKSNALTDITGGLCMGLTSDHRLVVQYILSATELTLDAFQSYLQLTEKWAAQLSQPIQPETTQSPHFHDHRV